MIVGATRRPGTPGRRHQHARHFRVQLDEWLLHFPLGNNENGKLRKAFASGCQPKAQWEWIYDAQWVKTVDNAEVWEITVALESSAVTNALRSRD